MSIFGSIMSKIFGGSAGAAEASASGSPAASTPSTSDTGTSVPRTEQVDVEAVLNGMAAQAGQQLNWRQSIVDLMKLLGLDSSLSSRTELAKELGYTGNTNDSATMNVWLHKQVMQKLAENGGKVPEELKH
jgi:Domain of unknown function (DUF3597)